MTDYNILGLHSVFQPEIANVNVSGFGASRGSAVLFQFDGTFIVLFQDVRADLVTLCFHEHLHPDCVGEVITGADELGFGGASSVKFLFAGFTYQRPGAKGYDTACVDSAVRVNGVGRIHPRADPTEIVGPDNVLLVVDGAVYVLKETFEFPQVLLSALRHARRQVAGGEEEVHACPDRHV